MTVRAVTRRLRAAVKRAASRLDDVGLDSVITWATRGQVDLVLARLARVLPIGDLTALAADLEGTASRARRRRRTDQTHRAPRAHAARAPNNRPHTARTLSSGK